MFIAWNLFLSVLCLLVFGVTRDGSAIPLESWDDQIAGAPRFVVLAEFDNEAVLDRETQLVWQRNLGIVYGNAVLRTSWETSHNACLNANIGGRMGWRLPSAEELASLIDPALTTLPLLPVGHPFLNVEFSDPEDVYWTNTSYLPSSVFVVCFGTTCKES